MAALGISALVLRGSFHRVEHVLLALATVFAAYILSGVLAGPDWGAAAKGLVVPSMPLTRDATLVAVATLGTTLAPWGLAFIQSYAVDKGLRVADLRLERVDVIVGAVLTGVIGLFIVVARAATLHAQHMTIDDAGDAARALEPLGGSLVATLFGLGFIGAALLAAAVVPLSTAYSVSEAFAARADVGDSFHEAPLFHVSFAGAGASTTSRHCSRAARGAATCAGRPSGRPGSSCRQRWRELPAVGAALGPASGPPRRAAGGSR